MYVSVKSTDNPGVRAVLDAVQDIPNTEYHEGILKEYTGHSKALLMRGGMTVAKAAYILEHEDRTRSQALILGSLFHDILERYNPDEDIELPAGYVISPYADFRTKEAKTWKSEMEETGTDIIKQEENDKIRDMVKAITSNPSVQGLLKLDHIREGTFTGELDGVNIKIRPDMLCVNHDGSKIVCVDWKTCQDAHGDPDNFSRDAYKLGYQLEAFFYTQILQDLTGLPCSFIFVVCEKDEPHQVALYNASPAFIDAGRDMWYGELLPKWEQYIAGEYEALWTPEHPILTLDPPAWAG